MVKLTKNLYVYDCFKKWSKFDVAWVFSDPHFDDPDCKFMDPNWPTPEEQVKLINSKVGKRDLLFILGDVGNVEWIKQLKGYKVLVSGNHDSGISNYKRKVDLLIGAASEIKDAKILRNIIEDFSYIDNDSVVTDNHLFDEVYDGPLFINSNLLLSHEEIYLPFGINVHGHNHNGSKVNINDGSVSLNVCSNIVEFCPQRLDKLIDGFKVKDIHRLAINKAIDRKH